MDLSATVPRIDMMVTGVNPPDSFGSASAAADGIVIFERPGGIGLVPRGGEPAIYLVGTLAAILDL